MPELIDRQALKNHLYQSQAEAFKRSEWYVAGAIQSFINLLDKQPTIEPEVRHGRWIVTDDCEKFTAKCSVCGRIEDSRLIADYPYCHCGARMDEDVVTDGTDGYTYYEIWNTTSEMDAECTERCVTLETAKEHLEKNHCDWYRPVGTGIIYCVKLVQTDDGTLNLFRTEIYRKG